jgi:hypothetical protein
MIDSRVVIGPADVLALSGKTRCQPTCKHLGGRSRGSKEYIQSCTSMSKIGFGAEFWSADVAMVASIVPEAVIRRASRAKKCRTDELRPNESTTTLEKRSAALP